MNAEEKGPVDPMDAAEVLCVLLGAMAARDHKSNPKGKHATCPFKKDFLKTNWWDGFDGYSERNPE